MRLGLTVTEFVDLAAKHSMVPVWAEVIADLETPMSVASRIYPRDCVIILESAERGSGLGGILSSASIHSSCLSPESAVIC